MTHSQSGSHTVAPTFLRSLISKNHQLTNHVFGANLNRDASGVRSASLKLSSAGVVVSPFTATHLYTASKNGLANSSTQHLSTRKVLFYTLAMMVNPVQQTTWGEATKKFSLGAQMMMRERERERERILEFHLPHGRNRAEIVW